MYCIRVNAPPEKKLQQLLAQQPALWRERPSQTPAQAHWSTGHAALDKALPWGGWPRCGLVDIDSHLPASPLRVFLPLIAAVTHAQHYAAFIRPAWIPFSPGLQQAGVTLERLLLLRADTEGDAHWLLESALRAPQCGLVLAWPATRTLPASLQRRWQLAAQAGQTLGLIYRPARSSRPYLANAQLQLRLDAKSVQILKARGSHIRSSITL